MPLPELEVMSNKALLLFLKSQYYKLYGMKVTLLSQQDLQDVHNKINSLEVEILKRLEGKGE